MRNRRLRRASIPAYASVVQPGADRTLLPEPLTLARSLMLRRLAYFDCALSRPQLAELDSLDCV